MKSALYNQKGEKVGEVDLPEDVFKQKINPDHIYQAVLYYENLKRKPIAKTKDRSEVRGGGRKPWRQKGTGRARHGSTRSPIWKGGGVTFGPSPEKFSQIKMSKKARKRAFEMVFSKKLEEKEIIFLDQLTIDKLKTKSAEKIIKNLTKIAPGIDKKKTGIALKKADENIKKAFRNIKNIEIYNVSAINAYFLLQNKYIIIEEKAVKELF